MNAASILATPLVLTVVLGLCHLPRPAQAQSSDDCLSAPVSRALELCQSIIDSGRREALVYWKLSSAQYQNGAAQAAERTLDTALTLFPGDTRLQSLQQLVTVDRSEQAMIAQSARLNQQSLDRGALKITCLTKAGDIGISACRRRLELTGEDSERIQDRLRHLQESQLASQQAVTGNDGRNADIEAPAREVATQAIPNTASYGETPSLDQAQQSALIEERRAAYRALVADVQTRLNEFGFEAGYPDGIPGRKTRAALSTFYERIGLPASTAITDLTLEELEGAQRKQAQAESLLQDSRAALARGDRDSAKERFEQARQRSPLLDIPADLERSLQGDAVTADAPVREQKPLPPSEEAPENVVVTSQVNSATSLASRLPTHSGDTSTDDTLLSASTSEARLSPDRSRQLRELLGEISGLHNKIRGQQMQQAQLLRAMREAL